MEKADNRELACAPIPELRALMNLDDQEICLLEGNAYGRVDAPLLFYREFRKQLECLGFEAHPLDNCLFLLCNQESPEKLDGISGCHVDDGIGGGNERYEAALKDWQSRVWKIPIHWTGLGTDAGLQFQDKSR